MDLTSVVVALGEVLTEARSTDASSGAWLTLLEQSRVATNRLAAIQAVALAKVAATDLVAHEDGTVQEQARSVGYCREDAAALVAGPLGAAPSQAQRRVEDAARQVSVMPALVEAMAAGHLDGHRAAMVVDELAEAPDDVARPVAAAVADQLLGTPTTVLRRRVRAATAKVAPEVVRERAERARQARSLRRWAEEPGVDAWFARFPAEASATAWAAVEEVARRYRASQRCTSLEEARADALLDLVTSRTTASVVLTLTVPADALPPDTQLGTPSDGGPDDSTPGSRGPGGLPGDPTCGAVVAAGAGTSTLAAAGVGISAGEGIDGGVGVGAAGRGSFALGSLPLPRAGASESLVEVRGLGNAHPGARLAGLAPLAGCARPRHPYAVRRHHRRTGARPAGPGDRPVPTRPGPRRLRARPRRPLPLPGVHGRGAVLRPRPRATVAARPHRPGEPGGAVPPAPSRQAAPRLDSAHSAGRHPGLGDPRRAHARL
jgi:hypothetical protein